MPRSRSDEPEPKPGTGGLDGPRPRRVSSPHANASSAMTPRTLETVVPVTPALEGGPAPLTEQERQALAAQHQLQDEGNARIGMRMRRYFPVDDE